MQRRKEKVRRDGYKITFNIFAVKRDHSSAGKRQIVISTEFQVVYYPDTYREQGNPR